MVDVIEELLAADPAAGAEDKPVEDRAGGVRSVAQEDLEDPPEVDVHRLGAQHVAQQHEGAVVGLDQGEQLADYRIVALREQHGAEALAGLDVCLGFGEGLPERSVPSLA